MFITCGEAGYMPEPGQHRELSNWASATCKAAALRPGWRDHTKPHEAEGADSGVRKYHRARGLLAGVPNNAQ